MLTINCHSRDRQLKLPEMGEQGNCRYLVQRQLPVLQRCDPREAVPTYPQGACWNTERTSFTQVIFFPSALLAKLITYQTKKKREEKNI